MKQELKYTGIEHQIIVCACSNPNHQIVISKFKGDTFEDHERWMYIRLIDNSFWNRLKNLFTKQKTFAEIMLTHDVAEKMIKTLQDFNGVKE